MLRETRREPANTNKMDPLRYKKVMRLKRVGESVEESREIGGFREEGYGYEVVDPNGKAIGYFGPDEYSDIIFEAHLTDEPSPR